MSPRNYGQRSYKRRTRGTSYGNNINQNRISQIRRLNNSNTIDRIVRITTPQITNDVIKNDFFNGTSFQDNNSFESLTLPAGCSISSSFP